MGALPLDSSEPSHDRPSSGRLFLVNAFAREVGMSTRTLRAHQARGVLPPPVRLGRQAFYTEEHRSRIESVKELQRRGFNLVAISAMLNGDARDDRSDKLAAMLRTVAERSPGLTARLEHHGLVSCSERGDLGLLRPRPIMAGLALRRLGIPTVQTLEILCDTLDLLEHSSEELAHRLDERVSRAAEGGERTPSPADGLTRLQVVVTLMSEGARAVAENVRPDPA